MFISWPVLLQHASMIQLLMVELKGEEKNNNHRGIFIVALF